MTGSVLVLSRRVCAAVPSPALISLALTHVSRSIIRHLANGRARAPGILTPCRTVASTPKAGARSEESSQSGQQEQEPRRTGAAVRVAASILAAWLALNAGLEVGGLDEWLAGLRTGKPLNEVRFVPYIVTSREQVSPTAFILTVKPKFALDRPDTSPSGRLLSVLFPRLQFPHTSHNNRAILEKAWDHGLWSVEIKQPQIQVARDYTPLPAPSREAEQHDLHFGHLRFLIRRMDGGEVSTYLSRLQVGDTVELRGPHLGFDVRARLGSSDKVVFLAGGTGIAPALQTARAVLDTETNPHNNNRKPSVSILWANRHRADCPGIPSPQGTQPVDISSSSNAITSLLEQMKARYGDSLHYTSTVDDENARVTPPDILRAAGSSSPPAGTRTLWSIPFFSSSPSLPTTVPDRTSSNTTTCKYHSVSTLISSPGRDEPTPQNHCACAGAFPGKNLLMVSGPEGFISAFSGPKRWGEGLELQGPVGGMAASLREADPAFWEKWLVLKL
ncbi:hypothetical protein B0T16DRAFT_87076 [Cercophora newfieldiana]|uniref:FAD-binding FR-type domain-containing protein n=1 Tax=Cercophora newfieldiana TaxID=92897 RepID=A0AA39YFQ0_9PEZI|nr:hypothetical protein B0T16DRAFT_87076 [Cercophora newfieldiana]